MHIRIIPILLSLLLIVSCKSTKKTSSQKKLPSVTVKESKEAEIKEAETIDSSEKATTSYLTNAIIDSAFAYSGTPYKYGGTSKKGMDCSGLIYTAFKENDVPLQRTSSAMATQGKRIKLNRVKKGDLLFFGTGKNRKRINHVGLVVKVDAKGIKFIHATTSRGVLISSLKEGYWNHAFVEARTIL